MDCKLNFTEICRCCTRTESCMTSIFDENVHSTYPAVKVMLNSITSLNVLEYDELPWMVCKLCLNSIQHAYIFIQHLKHIDVQLRQILLARRKEEDTLPQCATLKIEPEQPEIEEECNLQLQEQEQTDPLLTATKDVDENNSKMNQNLDRNEEMEEIEDVDNEAEPDYQAQRDIEGCINVDSSEGEDELLKVTKIEDMVDFDDVHENYQLDVEEGNSRDSLESESNHIATDDEIDEIWRKSPKSQSKVGRKQTSKFTLFKCKLCAYTCKCMSHINIHLQSHSKERPFACSKCTFTFTHKYNMLQHWRNCKGGISQHRNQPKHRNNLFKLVSCQDLKDPLKIKKYYTVTEIDVLNQNKDGGNIKVERPKDTGDDADTSSKFTSFKCKLCGYTCMVMGNLKKHLHIHCKDKPFTCSKCKRAFTQKAHMVQHGRICNGEIRYVRERKEPKQVISLQDLKDPLKIKQYYTEIDM